MKIAQNLQSFQVATASMLDLPLEEIHSSYIGQVDKDIWVGLPEASKHQVEPSTQQPKGKIADAKTHAV